MYDTAEAFAKACGYTAIWLERAGRFKAAKELYERNGFAVVARVDNQFQDEIMLKSIAPVGDVVGPPTAAAHAGRAAAAGALAGEHARDEAPLTRKQASAAAAARFRARKAAKVEAERAAKLAARRAEIAANVAKAIAERDGSHSSDVDRSVEAPAVERSIEAPDVVESEPQPEAHADGR